MFSNSQEGKNMIINKEGKEVNEITLNRAEWCYFVTKTGTKYVVQNARHKMMVTKPLGTTPLKITKEIKAANIKIV